jgi:hypothetical protein
LLPYSNDICLIAPACPTHVGHHVAMNQSTTGFPLNDSKDTCFPSIVFRLKPEAFLLLDIDTPTTQEMTIAITTITTIVTTVFDFKDCNLFAICLFVAEYYIGLWMAYRTLLISYVHSTR